MTCALSRHRSVPLRRLRVQPAPSTWDRRRRCLRIVCSRTWARRGGGSRPPRRSGGWSGWVRTRCAVKGRSPAARRPFATTHLMKTARTTVLTTAIGRASQTPTSGVSAPSPPARSHATGCQRRSVDAQVPARRAMEYGEWHHCGGGPPGERLTPGGSRHPRAAAAGGPVAIHELRGASDATRAAAPSPRARAGADMSAVRRAGSDPRGPLQGVRLGHPRGLPRRRRRG